MAPMKYVILIGSCTRTLDTVLTPEEHIRWVEQIKSDSEHDDWTEWEHGQKQWSVVTQFEWR